MAEGAVQGFPACLRNAGLKQLSPMLFSLLKTDFFPSLRQHLPAIAATDSLRLVAVYSRSLSSVNAFVEASKQHSSTSHDLDVYSEDPSSSGLDELLAREDIRTVVLALPITTQPEVIRKALAAGKSVISEKPVRFLPPLFPCRPLLLSSTDALSSDQCTELDFRLSSPYLY